MPTTAERLELEKSFAKLPAVDVPIATLARIGLRRETLAAPEFRGTIRLDNRGNLAFAQRDGHGFCGVERQPLSALSGTSPPSVCNGDRGLWVSNATRARDALIVVTATPLDAVAYHQVHRPENVRYVCTGNAELTPEQKKSLELAVGTPSKVGPSPAVVVAFSRDPRGEELANEVASMCSERTVRRHAPEFGATWTQALQRRERDHIRAQGHQLAPGLDR